MKGPDQAVLAATVSSPPHKKTRVPRAPKVLQENTVLLPVNLTKKHNRAELNQLLRNFGRDPEDPTYKKMKRPELAIYLNGMHHEFVDAREDREFLNDELDGDDTTMADLEPVVAGPSQEHGRVDSDEDVNIKKAVKKAKIRRSLM
jgi:hypothetical protein